jgi:hypothetical protein
MQIDPSFSSSENQALLVVCARKTVRHAAILGIIWGAINLVIGVFAIQANAVNVGLLLLALLMLTTGVTALAKPSLHSLLAEACVSALLFAWNVGITFLNAQAGSGQVNGHGLIWPAIAAVIFFRHYKKLGHLKEAMSAMDPQTVKEATSLCKDLFKAKLKTSPDVAEASSRRCRIRLMTGAVFCVQRNLASAFYLKRDQFEQCIPDLNRKRVRMVVRHPLGKLTYAFDKKNSDKIKGWLTASSAQAG